MCHYRTYNSCEGKPGRVPDPSARSLVCNGSGDSVSDFWSLGPTISVVVEMDSFSMKPRCWSRRSVSPRTSLGRHPSRNHGVLVRPQRHHYSKRLLEFHWLCTSRVYKNRASGEGLETMGCTFHILIFHCLSWFSLGHCLSPMASDKRERVETEEKETAGKHVFQGPVLHHEVLV